MGRSAGNCYNAAPARWPRVVEVVTANMGSSCPAETLHANLLFLKFTWGTSAFPPGLDRMSSIGGSHSSRKRESENQQLNEGRCRTECGQHPPKQPLCR